MFEVMNEFVLSQSRDDIWRILADLPKYRDWYPSILVQWHIIVQCGRRIRF